MSYRTNINIEKNSNENKINNEVHYLCSKTKLSICKGKL